MKKLLVILAVLALLPAATASAATFTFTQAQLLGMTKAWNNGWGETLDSVYIPLLYPDGVEFDGRMPAGATQWRSIAIGYSWPPPAPVNSLTGFDNYALTFLNVNNQHWWVNLYVNTGWTDMTEPNNFYENGWTELVNNGGTATLVLDLSGAVYLNHVTNIGFQLAFNDPSLTGQGLYQGDEFHMVVTPVPEPGSMLLLGTGLLGLAGAVRRRMRK